MAVFVIARENETEENKIQTYKEEADLRRLLFYCMSKSNYTFYNHVYALGIQCVADQMIFLQRCRYKPVYNRAVHYILSFDSKKGEKDVKVQQIKDMIWWIISCYFRDYQCVACLHTDKSTHLHVHIVINPVAPGDLSLYHYNFRRLKAVLANDLGDIYHVALQGMTYYDQNGGMTEGSAK